MKKILVFVLCCSLVPTVLAAAGETFLLSQKAMNKPTRGSATAPLHALARINSRRDFDKLSRTYYRGRFYALPHLMFVIDRRAKDRVYYVNSKAYAFHKDFVNAEYLSLERGKIFYENNYAAKDRRFFLGTIAYQTAVDQFTFEFWEGDRLSSELLTECYDALSRTFFTKIFFKPNSIAQEETAKAVTAASALRVPVITASDLASNQQYQALNPGAGIGQLRILERLTPETVIDRNQIVIFKEVPVQLTPLSGIITTAPASPLSHVNLLAKSWGIPNARIANADKLFQALEGKYVRLEVNDNDYKLTPANPKEVEARNREFIKRSDLVTPPADLRYEKLTDLQEQHAVDARRFGAKAANLGQIINAHNPAIVVPKGFSIPFVYYQRFLALNQLEDKIANAVEEDRFVHDPVYRKKRLAEIRQWIQGGHLEVAFKKILEGKAFALGLSKGLFARSSTNAEDLPNFSGAGLYTTVPNVRTYEQLYEAVKTVWASVWNYEAYEARESFGMNHFGVYPSVLVQEGIDAESAGVAITTDPFNRTNRGAVYINAKRGLGIKVVEGRRVAEQVLYNPSSNSTKILTRSDEDTMLKFDEQGGVKEFKIEPQRAVLTDAMIRRLARAALQIKRLFGGRDQDIEWVYAKGQLYIVQSRPYVENN
ncbi:MAG: PEP/pyruvate-binding domain-containing protein [Acidobacteria bacterium]|nr:PEP/pyruvate-binding domain-containing protein [Acidobacteriota bacterium]